MSDAYFGRNDYHGESVFIQGDWAPTAENINALPRPLKDYIHQLEMACARAGIVPDTVLSDEEARALHEMIEGLKPA